MDWTSQMVKPLDSTVVRRAFRLGEDMEGGILIKSIFLYCLVQLSCSFSFRWFSDKAYKFKEAHS